MGGTTFAPPEHSAPAVSFDVEAPMPEVSIVPVALAGNEVGESSWIPDRGKSYLSNSVLLV